jgi:hypothetical protein
MADDTPDGDPLLGSGVREARRSAVLRDHAEAVAERTTYSLLTDVAAHVELVEGDRAASR